MSLPYVQELAVGDDVVHDMPLMRFSCEGSERAIKRMYASRVVAADERAGACFAADLLRREERAEVAGLILVEERAALESASGGFNAQTRG